MTRIWNIFGGKKPASHVAQATPFRAGAAGSFDPHVCDGYHCTHITDFRTLIALVRAKAAAHPDRAVFATLDDYGQACYTSGHARGAHELDVDESLDLDAFYDREHAPGSPASIAHHETLFTVMRRNLLAKAEGITFADLAGKLDLNHLDSPGFLALNAAPDAALDDRGEHYLLLAPVDDPAEAISAFPNGYFHDDLSPMDILVLARRLRSYGYRLFGIGASYVGFLRDQPITDEDANLLARDILSLHTHREPPVQIDAVVRTLKAHEWLLLFYRNN